tara:strand:+ start:1111 stop:2472 length:1362 start_codon:yes stop_codon:yes gene_type:complete
MIVKESRILIVDDEPDICEQLSGLLNDLGYSCEYTTSSEKGIELFKKKKYSIVLLDIWLNNSKFDGFQALEKILEIDQNIPVIMISGHGNIETAVNSIKKGAYDFIEKPFDSDLLIFKIKKALENVILKRKIQDFIRKDSESKLVTFSKSAKILEKNIKQISKTDSNILLIGSDGSGKEFIASKIHTLSHRANKNFKFIDCRIDQDKLEKELFGFEENQVIEVLGVLEEINNGTIYFKNINLMSNKLQGKILRILEEKKFYRIGALNSKTLNVRVIASCHQKLKIKEYLREDLLKKLNLNVIEVPNLEKRKEDIDELISIFSSQVIAEKSLRNKPFSNDALIYLKNLSCIKNISQLKKFIEWIIFMLNDKKVDRISKNDLIELSKDLAGFDNAFLDDSMNLKIKDAREDFEKNYLIYNLQKYKYNVAKMSQEIGMERTALYRKLKILKISMET